MPLVEIRLPEEAVGNNTVDTPARKGRVGFEVKNTFVHCDDASSAEASTADDSPAASPASSNASPMSGIPDFLRGFETPMAMPPSYWTPKQLQKLPVHYQAFAEQAAQQAAQQAYLQQAWALQAMAMQQAQAALAQAAQQTPSLPVQQQQGYGQVQNQQDMNFYPAMAMQQLPARATPQYSFSFQESVSQTSSPAPSPAPSVNGDDKKKKKRSRDVPAARDHEMTVMLRNIPTQLTPKEVMEHLQAYRGVIDFLYVPIDFKNNCNLGYAFINFNRKEVGSRFFSACETLFPGAEKVPFVQPARVEGLAANVKRFRNSSVMGVLTEEYKPMLFENGVQKPFPGPSKKLPPVGPRFRPTHD